VSWRPDAQAPGNDRADRGELRLGGERRRPPAELVPGQGRMPRLTWRSASWKPGSRRRNKTRCIRGP